MGRQVRRRRRCCTREGTESEHSRQSNIVMSCTGAAPGSFAARHLNSCCARGEQGADRDSISAAGGAPEEGRMSAQEAAEQNGCTGGAPGRPKREQSDNCPGTRSNGAQKQSTERVIRSLGVLAQSTKQSNSSLAAGSQRAQQGEGPLRPCCACRHRHVASRAHLDGAGAQAQVLLHRCPGGVRRQWGRGAIRRGW